MRVSDPLELQSYELSCGCWDLNLDPLKEQPVLLTAQTSAACVPVHAHMCAVAMNTTDIRSSEVGVTGSCQLPKGGAGDQSGILCLSSKCSAAAPESDPRTH